MKQSIEKALDQTVEDDVNKTRKYLAQMIDIANMVGSYIGSKNSVFGYEDLLFVHHAARTGNAFDLDPYNADTALESVKTIENVWTLIEKDFPKLAEYAAVEAYKSIIGEEVFEEVLSDESYEKEGKEIISKVKLKNRLPDLRIAEKEDAMTFLIEQKPEVVKLQNFIRLTRIAENMRYIVLYIYKKKHSYATQYLHISSVFYTREWKNVFYHIPGRGGLEHVPFRFICKHQNNKEIGKLQFEPSFTEKILCNIDILQIKICENCLKIFFAEPRNMKYCSSKCNNRMKSKRYYEKNKS